MKAKHYIFVFAYLRLLFVALIFVIISSSLRAQKSGTEEPIFDALESYLADKNHDAVKGCMDSLKLNDPSFYEDHLERLLRYQGKCEAMRQDYTNAFKLFFDGLKLAESRDNQPEVAQIKMELGLIFLQFDEPNLAAKMFQDAESLFLSFNDDELYARCGYLGAVTHKRMGAFDRSNELLEIVMKVYLKNSDSLGIAKTHNAIGLNYKNLKQVELAVPQFEAAIGIFSRLDNKPNLAKAYNNLANVYQIDEQWALAKLNHESSIRIKKIRNDNLGIAASYINLSVIYKRTNEFNKALDYGNRSLALLDEIGQAGNRRRTEVYGLMSELHEIMGNLPAALKYARMEHQLLAQSRVEDEVMLIQLFEKKQDVKFYTISDSLLKNQKILQNKIDEAQSENVVLTQEKGYVLTMSLITVSILLLFIAIVIYWRFLSTKRMKDKLEITNEELFATRISKEEKEVLLQEIHHRVKNNMQIISSLIRLQSNQYENDDVNELFLVTQNRIKSMALVHEYLYQSKNFERLEIKGYLTELVRHLINSHQDGKKVDQFIDVSVDFVSIDTIIPLGLVVNEIVTNSLKHAFSNDQKDGLISLVVAQNDQGYLLVISDNGKGDDPVTGQPKKTLGHELIDSLIQQLDGTWKLDKLNGYNYEIQLPTL